MQPLPRHPRDRLRLAIEQLGERTVALWCADLIVERVHWTDPDLPDLDWLGGDPGAYHRQRHAAGDPEPGYWPRVWAARGLLYAWDEAAIPNVVAGLADEAWRVREMCAKVSRLREVGEAAHALETAATDEIPRVRTAALRALGRVGESEHVELVQAALDDHERAVVAAAETALDDLARRLDHDR